MAGGATPQSHISRVATLSIARREPIGLGEIRFVRSQRERLRASWQACADMIGRSEHDTRMACDETYPPAIAARGRVDLSTSANVAFLADDRAAVLASIKALFAYPIEARIAQRLDATSESVRKRLAWASGANLVMSEPAARAGEPETWHLTVLGELSLAAWKAKREGDHHD